MKNKKLISMLLVTVLSVSLTACGNSDESKKETTTTTATTATTVTTTETKSPETTTTTTNLKDQLLGQLTTVATTTVATTTTTTTTTKEYDNTPEEPIKELDVVGINGYSDLRSGSGITAAAIVLKYYGIDVELLKLKQYADIYGLNTIEDGVTPSPWDVIVGEPLTLTAKYYAKPIVDMVNNYVNKNGLNNIKAKDISGATLDELMSYIDKGKPVIVWGTETGEPAIDGVSWILPSGKKFTAKALVDVYVLVGYNESKVMIMSHIGKVYELGKEEFFSMYESVYSQAILIE